MDWVARLCSHWLESFTSKQGLSRSHGASHASSGIDAAFRWEAAPGQRSFLHVGCGGSSKQHAAPGFRGDDWREIRLDMDATVVPDIVASMTDMAVVPDVSVDAIYSSHNIEHLYAHEVPVAFAEFYRVLKPEGFLVLTCPDLRSICSLVVDDKIDLPAYLTVSGEAITPLDVLYGHRRAMAEGNLFMAHRFGFTQRTLMEAARNAGFKIGHSLQRPSLFDLWLLAFKSEVSMDQLMQQARVFLPVQE
ncbi:MAG: methyltransferase domain-containing protein [Burkholderiales bacterium]|nr:methyltransferase domain-containing protein [Burkholderiales bacterium]